VETFFRQEQRGDCIDHLAHIADVFVCSQSAAMALDEYDFNSTATMLHISPDHRADVLTEAGVHAVLDRMTVPLSQESLPTEGDGSQQDAGLIPFPRLDIPPHVLTTARRQATSDDIIAPSSSQLDVTQNSQCVYELRPVCTHEFDTTLASLLAPYLGV
jgi:hypothetical protein